MKLITHNFLTSRFLKNVRTGYPLSLVVEKFEELSPEYDQEFLKKMLNRIDYNALKKAAQVCGQELPDEMPDVNTQENDLKAVHKALLGIEVITGTLICPETGRKFPISEGIPNMLCQDEE